MELYDLPVDQAKLRWRIERDYQELKQEIGLGHYEGRGWRGFHHHATLAIAAYGFLVSERSRIPPSAPRCRPLLKASPLSESYRPRGAANPARTPSRRPVLELPALSPGSFHDVPAAQTRTLVTQ